MIDAKIGFKNVHLLPRLYCKQDFQLKFKKKKKYAAPNNFIRISGIKKMKEFLKSIHILYIHKNLTNFRIPVRLHHKIWEKVRLFITKKSNLFTKIQKLIHISKFHEVFKLAYGNSGYTISKNENFRGKREKKIIQRVP